MYRLLSICIVLGLTACSQSALVSQVPVPTGYPLAAQQRMQALQHWDLLADKVARQTSLAMDAYFPANDKAVYVAPLGTTVFAKAYREALLTHLIAYGVPLATGPEEAVLLEANTAVIAHDRALVRSFGGRSLLEPEFVQGRNADGTYQEPAIAREYTGSLGKEAVDAEIQVNSALTHNGAYLYRDSSMFYIHLSQWPQYQHHAPAGVVQAKRYALINK